MPSLQVRDVPEDLHDRLRERARDERLSLGDYVLDLIERDLALPSRREWEARLGSRRPVDVDTAEAVERGRAERDAELARTRRR
jgi:hypothetical protein